MRKRIVPALLALCMVMALLPAMTFADGEPAACETCGCVYSECSRCIPAGDEESVDPQQPAVCGCDEGSEKCGNESCTICAEGDEPGGDEPAAPVKTCTCDDAGCPHENEGTCGAEVAGSGSLCETCEAYAKSGCTGAPGCTGKAHNKDCLSLCTMNDNCPNTSGDPSAHRTGYGISEGGSLARPEFATWEEAKRAADDRNEALNQDNPAGDSSWAPVVVHCPVAGVAVDVVLDMGGGSAAEPTEPAAPEKDPNAPAKAEDFSDVPAGAWYADDLTALMEKGVFVGQGKTFSPQSNTTGAEVVVLLSRLLGKDLVTTGSAWSKEAAAWAADEGLSEGITISTTGELSREDLVLMLWRAAGKPASSQSLAGFSDADRLEGDRLAAMRWAVEKGIVKGSLDGSINPDVAAKRCEMAALLVRYDAAVNP